MQEVIDVYFWYKRWEVWKSVPCRSCIFFFFQRLRVVPEILVSDKILNFVRHLSESSTYILQIISERNAHTFPDINSRFNLIITSREMDNNMLPIWGSKWISAFRNLERISFKRGSQSGSVLRTVDLLTFPTEEFISDSTYFFLDRITFTYWRFTALLVSLANVKTRLSRGLPDFSFKNKIFTYNVYIYIYITSSISTIKIRFEIK